MKGEAGSDCDTNALLWRSVGMVIARGSGRLVTNGSCNERRLDSQGEALAQREPAFLTLSTLPSFLSQPCQPPVQLRMNSKKRAFSSSVMTDVVLRSPDLLAVLDACDATAAAAAFGLNPAVSTLSSSDVTLETCDTSAELVCSEDIEDVEREAEIIFACDADDESSTALDAGRVLDNVGDALRRGVDLADVDDRCCCCCCCDERTEEEEEALFQELRCEEEILRSVPVDFGRAAATPVRRFSTLGTNALSLSISCW